MLTFISGAQVNETSFSDLIQYLAKNASLQRLRVADNITDLTDLRYDLSQALNSHEALTDVDLSGSVSVRV